jgi:hypothetical protein
MIANVIHPTQTNGPSPARLRYVERRLEADAEAILRDVAYVLHLTQRVKQEIVSNHTERETVGA